MSTRNLPLGVITDPAMYAQGASLRDRCFDLLHFAFGLDQNVIENLSFRENGEIFDSELATVVGNYVLVDDALPVIGFHHKNYAIFQKQRRSGNIPCFIPRIYQRHNVGIMVQDEDAPAHLNQWLHGNIFTQFMDRPGYKITRLSVPFFQGGAHDPEGKWFYVEFLGRREIYKTVKWINENFRYE